MTGTAGAGVRAPVAPPEPVTAGTRERVLALLLELGPSTTAALAARHGPQGESQCKALPFLPPVSG